MNPFFRTFAIGLALAATSLSLAQNQSITDDIVTDRPDITEASSLIPFGSIQIETGGIYERQEDGALRTELTTYNTTLLRLGVLKNLELRLGFNNINTRNYFDGTELDDVQAGFSPLLLGVKVGISDEDGWVPEAAFIGHINPRFLASTDYRPDTTGGDFVFSMSWNLDIDGFKFSYGNNLGGRFGEFPGLALLQSHALGFDLGNDIGFYAEYYSVSPEGSSTDHFVDGGFTWMASRLLQFDVSAGTGIDNTQQYFVSAGVSYRMDQVFANRSASDGQ